MLQSLDKWVAQHPWHPRLLPFVVYVALLIGVEYLRSVDPRSYLLSYPLMCGATLWLLWRYRRATPELNWRFHWAAVAVAIAAAAAWIGLGLAMERLSPGWFGGEGNSFFKEMGPAAGWAALAMRLLGMSIVVPMFEELFFRSALLRSLGNIEAVKAALVQGAEDLPVIGDRVMRSAAGRRYVHVHRPMAAAFEATPLGSLSVFGVLATSILWAPISHVPRDWPGTVACGILYALLVGWTNRGERRLGLGPVIWAHGLTNALLWAWTISFDDWRFL